MDAKINFQLSKLATILVAVCWSLIAHSQVPQMVKLDSLWALRTVTANGDKGAYNVAISEKVDSSKLVQYYVNVMSQKKMVIDSQYLQREWDAYNDHLRKVTGKDYASHMSAAVVKELEGNWEIEPESLLIHIDKDLKISGGTIKGKVEVIDGATIKLTGVYDKPVIFKAGRDGLVSEDGKKMKKK